MIRNNIENVPTLFSSAIVILEACTYENPPIRIARSPRSLINFAASFLFRAFSSRFARVNITIYILKHNRVGCKPHVVPSRLCLSGNRFIDANYSPPLHRIR